MVKKIKKTSTFDKIVSQIEKVRAGKMGKYPRWYVGVTEFPQRRYKEHMRKIGTEPFYWFSWYAYSKKTALTIEKHFHDLGMLEGAMAGGVKNTSKFVYIYKLKPDILDELFKKWLNEKPY